MPDDKTVVLGLVSTKSPQLETKEMLRQRINEAAKYVPLARLGLSPQCGFSGNIGNTVMTADEQMAKLRLVVETARSVWDDVIEGAIVAVAASSRTLAGHLVRPSETA
jgi:5-methyltetrahydropteroyltriglutamate--homocysteine methyltransferase